jgi:PAS domain S-box-containing protein
VKDRLRILLIESDPKAAQLIRDMLVGMDRGMDLTWTDCLTKGIEQLVPENPRPDSILLDLSLPGSQGLNTLKQIRSRVLRVPVIVLAEMHDEELELEAMRAGAQDYHVKGEVDGKLLTRAIRYAIERDKAKEALNRGERTLSCRIIHNEDRQAVAGRTVKMLAGGGTSSIEHRIIDGIADIAEREDTERELLRSEEIYRTAVEHSNDGIGLVKEGKHIYVNKKFLDIFGYDAPGDIIGKPTSLVVHPDYHKEQKEYRLRREEGRAAPERFEFKGIKKDGTEIFVEASLTKTDYLGEQVLFVFSRDITQRKEAEYKLYESEERYRTAIEHSNDGVALVRDGEHIYVNQKFLDIFGYDKPEEIVGTTAYIIAHPDDRPMVIEYSRKRQQGEAVPSQYTFKGIKKDGATCYINVSVAAMLLQGERVILAFMRDITEHVLAERKIVESEQSLQAILKASPIGIGRVKNRVIDWVNEFMCRMSGYTFDELEGQSTRLLHESDEAFETVGESLNQTGQAEHRMIRKDGTARDVLLKISPVNNPSHIFTVIDMTEQKEAEEALRKSEVLYRTLAEKSSEILMLGNAEHIRTYVSPNITKILGYSIEEFLAGSHTEFIHPDSLSTEKTARSWILEHPGESVIFETRNRHKNGSWRWFECTACNLLEEPKVNALVMNLKDITERKDAEAALFESETKYRSVVENSLVGFYVIQDNLFRFVNNMFCKIFGFAYEEIVDILGPGDFTHPEDREMVEENLKKRLVDGIDHIEYDFRAVRKDGTTITLKVLGSSILYDGRPAATGTLIDITKEKTLESRLRQAQKMEAIGTLAGGVAHDFNNILTALTGYGTLLQLKLDKGNPLQHYVDQILSASMKGANLTRSLLAFSRKQPISLNPVNLNDIIKGTEKLLKRLLTEDIILRALLTSDDIMIMADPTQIDQILFNMVSNARDAMPKGGSLTIETKVMTLDDAFIKVHGFGQPGKYALLSTSDTGIGMDAAVKEHIFDPFFTTKEVGKGTGLGLSTVYGIVKQHNGYITIYSEPNIGTTVRIYFPLTITTAKTDASSSESIRGGKETILVAEDDGEVRHLVKNILSEFGYTIIEAKDGEDAISKFNKHKNVELLILDSVMPKKNGRAVYDEISTTRPHTKVIFTSGYTRDVILDKGIEDKQFVFIAKPLSPNELLKKVREVLDGK